MKKKFFSVIVAIIAMLALSLNVFAANSIVGSIDMPQASSDKGSVTLGKVPSGKYSRDLQNVIDRLNNAARNSSVKNAFGDKLPSSVNLYDKNGVLKKNIDLGVYKFLSPVMDLTFDGVTPSADNPVRVTFVANNMTDNIQVDILYYCPEQTRHHLRQVPVLLCRLHLWQYFLQDLVYLLFTNLKKRNIIMTSIFLYFSNLKTNREAFE